MDVLGLKAVLAAGGSVIVDARALDVLGFKSVAASGKDKGGRLTITNAQHLSVLDCKSIAASNPGAVTFDFTA